MPRKVFLSFLGITNYEPCNYFDEPNPSKRVDNVKYIQEAILKLYCGHFTDDDVSYIFVTEDAKVKNWLDDGHRDRKTKTIIKNDGLSTRLEQLSLPCEIEPVNFTEPFLESEIWELFERMYNLLQPSDELYIDITHSFRSIPMLAMVLVNYAKTIKKIRVKGIFYGAFEFLGKDGYDKSIPVEEKDAPIVHLTNFSKLQDWTFAANGFMTYGTARGIRSVFKEHYKLAYGIDDKLRSKFEALITNLEKVTDDIATARGFEIYKGQAIEQLRQSIKVFKDYTFLETTKDKLELAPLVPLLEKVEERTNAFETSETNNGLVAVKWCIDNNLIQQGITLLQEFIITTCMLKAKLRKKAVFELNNRETMSASLNGVPPQKITGEYKFIFPEVRLVKELQPIFKKITTLRNDINHAGFVKKKNNKTRNIHEAEKFKANLEKYHLQTKKIIQKNS